MRSGEPRQAGFNLVLLVMIIAVLNIAIAAALPLWSQAIRREKEEELIARGFQYAEAIRVFQRRFGRLPARLEELTEIEPRSIRQLWKDPMTEDGSWAVLVDTPQGTITFPPELPPGGAGTEPPAPLPAPKPGDPPPALPGPIRGVKSKSTKEAIHVLFGRTHYNEWEFRIETVTKLAAVPGGPLPRWTALNIGRPFRYQSPGGPGGGRGVGPMPPVGTGGGGLKPPPVGTGGGKPRPGSGGPGKP
ncbi:MAG: hypothetical protein U0X73_10335 [Thermoanaerobaculia bacterium]